MICPSGIDLEQLVPVNGNKFLFHYTTYSSALGILLSQQMRLSSLANMNDPLEFEDHSRDGLVFHGNPSNEDLAKWIHDFVEAVKEKNRSVRLASFAMDMPLNNPPKGAQDNLYNNLCKGWARSRMWAQYADKHRGICLIFDKENLIKAFKDEFKEDSCEALCKAVEYTNDLDPLKDALCKSCKSLLTTEKINFLFQKCQDFRDEQEFRLLLINKKLKDAKELVSFSIADSLCGVISGVNFPKEDRLPLERAMEFCNPEIRYFSIRWEYGVPNLYDYAHSRELIKRVLSK